MRGTYLAVAAAMLIAGCGSDSASYMVNGDKDNAFSLFRDKAFPGREWHVEIVITHMPECQRRYTLKKVRIGDYKTTLYRDADGNYAVQTDEGWYAGRLEGCRLQPVTSAPANPGQRVGTWEAREGGLKFYPAGK